MSARKHLKLRLVIDVTYDQGRASEEELTKQLTRAADHLYDEGLLSGDTEAETVTWSSSVVKPDDRQPQKIRMPPPESGVAGITQVVSRTGEVTVQVTCSRRCHQEGCRGLELHIRWPDGKYTWVCTKALKRVGSSDNTLQIR